MIDWQSRHVRDRIQYDVHYLAVHEMSIMIDYKFTAEDYSIFVALLENSHEFKI